MRTITKTVYHYNELPTEEAKKKARQWWIDREMEDPAWLKEHQESMKSAMSEVEEYWENSWECEVEEAEKWQQSLFEKSRNCELTGYCADALLSDLIKRLEEVPPTKYVESYYNNKWEEEMFQRAFDDEGIEEIIQVNEYEFFEDGSIC